MTIISLTTQSPNESNTPVGAVVWETIGSRIVPQVIRETTPLKLSQENPVPVLFGIFSFLFSSSFMCSCTTFVVARSARKISFPSEIPINQSFLFRLISQFSSIFWVNNWAKETLYSLQLLVLITDRSKNSGTQNCQVRWPGSYVPLFRNVIDIIKFCHR